MKTRPLLLDDAARARIREIIAYATEHVVTRARLVATVELDAPPIGDDPHHVAHFFQGFRVVYSHEDQPPPVRLCRHLSVSVDDPTKTPSPAAVAMLMQEFGFTERFCKYLMAAASGIRPPADARGAEGTVWIEHHAINVLERIETT